MSPSRRSAAASRRSRTGSASLLFSRGAQGVTLTVAGDQFRSGAEETIRRIHQSRREAREASGKEATTLRFAATHALSFTFFPRWIRGFEQSTSGTIRLISDHMQACEELMLHGEAQFLLCHHHDDVPSQLSRPASFARSPSARTCSSRSPPPTPPGRRAGACQARRRRRCAISATARNRVSGRIIAARRAHDPRTLAFETVFTSHLAAALLSMARDGSGIAWLPQSLVEQDIKDGRLARAGDESFDIPLEIRLFRPHARQSRAAEALWQSVSRA